MQKIIIVFVALVLGLGLAVWDAYAPPPGTPAAVVFPDAPDFAFETLDGAAHRLSDFRGRTVLINVWATWCAPCVVEMPELVQLAARENLVFIALSVDKNPQDIRPFFDKLGVDYSHVFLVHDGDKAISKNLYGVKMYPESFVITPEGTIRDKIEGVIDWLGPEGRERLGI